MSKSRSFGCFLAVIFFLVGSAGRADTTETSPNPREAEIHRTKAKQLADEKQWQQSRDEAETATKLDSTDMDAWLILGTVEQRLEHFEAAREAFRMYLALNPPEKKAEIVRAKIAELEKKSERKKKEETEDTQQKYSSGGTYRGFDVSFSPVYKPSLVDQFGSSLSNRFQVDFLFGKLMRMGISYAHGTIPNANFSSLIPPVTVPSVGQTLLGITIGADFPLNDAFDSLGPIQLMIPLEGTVGGVFYSPNPASAMDITADIASGFGVRFVTRGAFIAQVDGLYHLGFGGHSAYIPKANGTGTSDYANASPTGPELRLTVGFLFNTETDEGKARREYQKQ